jgi:PhnB protein
MQVQPYLFFDGRCEEAIEFYKKAIGAEVSMLLRYKDSPDKNMAPPGDPNKVMHCEIKIGESTVSASDGRNEGQAKFHGFSLTLIVGSEAEAQKLFSALAQGGQVQLPLTKTFFSPSFGMLADRFGVGWMIYVTK